MSLIAMQPAQVWPIQDPFVENTRPASTSNGSSFIEAVQYFLM